MVKKRKNSKQKGNGFEREIVTFLNTIYETDTFMRTPSSGSYFGKSNFYKNKNKEASVQNVLSSDIITPEWFPCAVECKHYTDKPNHSKIIKENDSDLDIWLSQCTYDAKNMNLCPLLFFKTNNKGTYCAIPYMFILDMEQNLTHYSKYNEFLIIGIDNFEKNKQIFKELLITKMQNIINWLSESVYITELTLKNIK